MAVIFQYHITAVYFCSSEYYFKITSLLFNVISRITHKVCLIYGCRRSHRLNGLNLKYV